MIAQQNKANRLCARWTTLLSAAAVVICSPALAAVLTWTGASSFDFYDAGNWNPVGFPSLTNDLVFPTIGTSTYIVATDTTANMNCNSITFNTTNGININSNFGSLRNLVIDSGDITR